MNQSSTPTLATAIHSYLEAKRLDGYSPRTLYSYRRQLQHLANALGNDTPVEHVRLEHLRAYLSGFTHLKMSSLANRVRVVKVFFKWLHEEEVLLRNPAVKLKEPRLPHRIPKALSVEEVELLRDACESPLEHALVEVFFDTGCRVGEVHRLNHDKVDWTRRSTVWVRVIRSERSTLVRRRRFGSGATSMLEVPCVKVMTLRMTGPFTQSLSRTTASNLKHFSPGVSTTIL